MILSWDSKNRNFEDIGRESFDSSSAAMSRAVEQPLVVDTERESYSSGS